MLSRIIAPVCLSLFLLIPGARAQEPLPVELFAKLPMIGGPSDSTSVTLSPDGAHYAAVMSINGEPALVAVPTNGSKDIKAAMFGDYQPRWVEWATNQHILVSSAFPAQRYGYDTLETRLAFFDIESGALENLLRFKLFGARDVPPFNPQFQDGLVSRLPLKGDQVLVALNREDPGLPTIYGFSLGPRVTGYKVMRYRAGIHNWRQDAAGAVRLGYGFERGMGSYLKPKLRLIFRASEAEDFKTVATFDPRDLAGDAFGIVGFTEDPNVILINDLNEHGRTALYKFDMVKSEVVGTVFSHEKYDVSRAMFEDGTDRLIGVAYMADEPVLVYFDEKEKEDQAGLDRGFPGLRAHIVSRSLDGDKAIARTESASSPPQYHYMDLANGKYVDLGSAYPQLKGLTLSETRPISYAARDGLQIDGYLTAPKGSDARNLPLVVHPHGGPASRDSLRYDYWVQYFASRGWAVLQMNFRGSTGYGDALKSAGDHEWGRAMQDDITDGVRWAIDQGFADPARICIVGASYGGYAALQGAASTPELYRCIVALNGVSDIKGLISDEKYYTNFMFSRDYLSQDDPGAVSPANHAEKVVAPVLVAYSTKDRNVKYDQSTGMIAALRRAGKGVVEVKLEDADHYLTHERHRIAFFQAMDAFLIENLGLGLVPSPEAAGTGR